VGQRNRITQKKGRKETEFHQYGEGANCWSNAKKSGKGKTHAFGRRLETQKKEMESSSFLRTTRLPRGKTVQKETRTGNG